MATNLRLDSETGLIIDICRLMLLYVHLHFILRPAKLFEFDIPALSCYAIYSKTIQLSRFHMILDLFENFPADWTWVMDPIS